MIIHAETLRIVMETARQIVRSYGPTTIATQDRENLCAAMDHYEKTAYPDPPTVFQDWMLRLPMQQQSVLVIACRGPDGVGKRHPTKRICEYYRAAVLKAAHFGRPMRVGEMAPTFMNMGGFDDNEVWGCSIDAFFDHCDQLPHHFYMHLMHGAEIVGYCHSDALFRNRWLEFYRRCCHDLHLGPETKEEMDTRLGDWGRRSWGK